MYSLLAEPPRHPVRVSQRFIVNRASWFRRRRQIIQIFPEIEDEVRSHLNDHGTRKLIEEKEGMTRDPTPDDLWNNYIQTGALARFLASRHVTDVLLLVA